MEKFCAGCSTLRPHTDWPKSKNRPDGLGTQCKVCMAAYRAKNKDRLNDYRRKYYRSDPNKFKNYAKERWVTHERDRTYGLVPGTIKTMLESQNFACANSGCAKSIEWSTCHVDHDHACCSTTPACGKCVRGLLCKGCNWILGHAGDKHEVLYGLASYLGMLQIDYTTVPPTIEWSNE
jgi:hypothetical protein